MMTTTTRSASSSLPAILLAVSLLPTGLCSAQERGPQQPARVQDPVRASAERDLKLALDKMVTTEKLTAAQAGEMYAIAFPEDRSEGARFEAYLKENPRVAKAIEVGKLTRGQALAGFRAREDEKEVSRKVLLEVAHRKLVAAEPELGRTPREELMPRLEQMIADGLVVAGAELTNHERVMTLGLYCNNLIESGQVARFDADLQKVYDIANGEILRQGSLRAPAAPAARAQVAGPVRDLAFAVYEVQAGDWNQVLGESLLLSEQEPLARGRAASGLLDLQLRDQALPDRAGRATFAMRFEGLLTAKETGQYTFRLRADDQAQLFLDGKLAASYRGNAQGAAKLFAVDLTEGDHRLQVDFADWGGAWWLELVMTEPGGRQVALSSETRGFEGAGRGRRAAKMKLAAREPVPVDWEAEYEAFLGANPRVEAAVEAGRITKEQVLAGIKARAKEVQPEDDPEVAGLLARFEAMRPGSAEGLRKMLAEGRVTKEDLLVRLQGRGARARAPEAPKEDEGEPAPARGAAEGRGGEDPDPVAKRPSREDYARIAAEIEEAVAAGKMTAEQGREKLLAVRRSMAKKRVAPKEVDWEAEYAAFLKANPKVREQITAGKVTKEQVLAGLKARAKEVEPEEDSELEAILARFEAMRPGSAASLRQSLAEGRVTKEDLLARLEGVDARRRGRGDGEGDPDPEEDGEEPPPERGKGGKGSGEGEDEGTQRGGGGR